MAFTKRSIGKLYLFIILTLGIYGLYWLYKTKIEIQENYNTNIPTCIFMIIPILNIYWLFRFTEAYVTKIRKKDEVALWFIIFFLVGIIMPYVVQKDLNNLADNPNLIQTGSSETGRICPGCGRPIPMDANVCPYCGKDFRTQ